MRTFRRDYPEHATALFTETTGKDLSVATVTVGLGADENTPPAAWAAPDLLERPTPSTIRASLLVRPTTTTGTYVLWVKVVDGPETLARAADNERIQIV